MKNRKTQKPHSSWLDILELFSETGEFTQEKYIEWLNQISIVTGVEQISLSDFHEAQKYPCGSELLEMVLIWRLKLEFTIDI